MWIVGGCLRRRVDRNTATELPQNEASALLSLEGRWKHLFLCCRQAVLRLQLLCWGVLRAAGERFCGQGQKKGQTSKMHENKNQRFFVLPVALRV